MRFTCFLLIPLRPLVVYLINMNTNMIPLKNRNFSFGFNKKTTLGYKGKFLWKNRYLISVKILS